MSDDVLVKVDNVSKRFCRSLKRSLWYGLQDLGSEIGGRRHGGGSGLPQSSADVQLRPDEFWAVKDVSFELRRGDCLGLIGRNGAGKTTLLRMLNGLIKPDTGLITLRGEMKAIIALGAGFNPVLTGRENIYVNGSVLGKGKAAVSNEIDEIIDFSGLDEFIDSPVNTYSSGMAVRLGFAIAALSKPDILILDEVLAVGDEAFRSKCLIQISKLMANSAVILVSHQMLLLQRSCNKAVVLEKGIIEEQGDTAKCISLYSKINSQGIPPSDSITFLSNRINKVSLIKSDCATINGKSLSMDIEIKSNSINSYEFIIGITEEETGELVAQSLASAVDSPQKSTSSIVSLTVEDLQLKSGKFLVNLSIIDPSSKLLLGRILNIAQFTHASDWISSSYYQPRANYKISTLAGEARIFK